MSKKKCPLCNANIYIETVWIDDGCSCGSSYCREHNEEKVFCYSCSFECLLEDWGCDEAVLEWKEELQRKRDEELKRQIELKKKEAKRKADQERKKYKELKAKYENEKEA